MLVRNKKTLARLSGSSARRPASNPLRMDPTRTTTLRLKATRLVRRKFAMLKGLLTKLVIVEDAFGLGPPNVLRNSFCPTGPGGGVDPTCSPGSMTDSDKIFGHVFRGIPPFKSTSNPNWRVVEVDPKTLTATRPDLKSELIRTFRSDSEARKQGDEEDLPRVIEKGGILYLVDGSHRVAADILDKKDRVKVNLITANVENCAPGQLREAGGRCGPGVGISIPRDEMPQIKGEDFQEFLKFARERGVVLLHKTVPADELSPTQAEFRQERVDAIPAEKLRDPILVSQDLYVLDGTHRWVKHWQADKRAEVPVVVLGLDLRPALELMKEFPKAKFVANVFCPTGEGGGVDPSCSPGKTIEVSSSKGKVSVGLNVSPESIIRTLGKSGSDFGKGLLHDDGRIYTWPEADEVDHQEVAKSLGFSSEEVTAFYLRVRRSEGIKELVVGDEVVGPRGLGEVFKTVTNRWRGSSPTTNRFQFISSPQKVEEFQRWLRQQFRSVLLGKSDEELWAEFARQGYARGAGRAFDDVNRIRRWSPGAGDFYEGSRRQFLQSAFGRPESVDKLKLLAGRSFTDLVNVTEDMATRMSRTLMDGLSRGANPRELVDDLVDDLDVSEARAETIARTEIIRAHAEGQLDALTQMGVEEVGVAVEWSTAGDLRVCPQCRPLEGVVLTVEEAHGLIPAHPNAVFAPSTFAPYGECEEIVRAWYSGPAVVLTLGSGEHGTTIGPNHPIMTRRGMVPAAQLRKGDQVLYDTRQDRRLHGVDRKQVPTVQHVFESLLFVLGDSSVVSTASDLHGDVVFCQGKVDAIRPARGLLPVLDSFGVEKLRQDDLARTDAQAQFRPGLGSSDFPTQGVGVASPSIVSGGGLPSPLLGAHSRPLDGLGLALGSHRDTGSYESTVYRPSRDAEALGDGVSGFACKVTLNDFFVWKTVHGVSFSRYEGWAFDATTATSLYYSDSLIVSNCRCAFIPANVGEDTSKQIRSKKEIEAAFEESGIDPPELDFLRPKSLIEPTKNEFCPTGKGGGVDPTCKADGSGIIKDKHGQEYQVKFDERTRTYTVGVPGKEELHDRGVTAGGATLKRVGDIVSDVGIHGEFQRRGLASALYRHIEKHIGKPLRPNEFQTPDGEALWKARHTTKNEFTSLESIVQFWNSPTPEKEKV